MPACHETSLFGRKPIKCGRTGQLRRAGRDLDNLLSEIAPKFFAAWGSAFGLVVASRFVLGKVGTVEVDTANSRA